MPNIIKMSKRAKLIIYATAFIVFPNFITFWIVAAYLGGDALNGYIQNDHYFVCAHGVCREVSRSVWNYSYWHAISAIAGHILIFLEAAVLVNTKDIEIDFNHPPDLA